MLKHFAKLLLKSADAKPEKIHRRKTTFAENLAIMRKRKLYKSIKWSKEQKKEFDSFCKSVYGKKISPRWHKLYQSINGIFDVAYIPEKIFTTILELNANNYSHSRILQDKNLLQLLLNNKVKTPDTIVFNSYGKFYNKNRELISEAEALNIAIDCGLSVLKPTVNSSSGKNVVFLDIKNGVDKATGVPLKALFDKYGENFTLQRKLVQCKEINDIYPNAINTFRITTYVLDGKVYTFPCAIRIGSGGSALDNIHAGGYSVSVSDDGTFGRFAYKLGRCDCKDKIEKHPDTGVCFHGYKIPNFEKVIQTAKQAHSCFVGVGFISWDIILDKDYIPVIIEANLLGQGSWLPQVIHGKGLFGNNTSKVIEYYYRR